VKIPYIDALLEGCRPFFLLVLRNPYAACDHALRRKPPSWRATLPYEQQLQLAAEHWENVCRIAFEAGGRRGSRRSASRTLPTRPSPSCGRSAASSTCPTARSWCRARGTASHSPRSQKTRSGTRCGSRRRRRRLRSRHRSSRHGAVRSPSGSVTGPAEKRPLPMGACCCHTILRYASDSRTRSATASISSCAPVTSSSRSSAVGRWPSDQSSCSNEPASREANQSVPKRVRRWSRN
jgi:hypothetical protein